MAGEDMDDAPPLSVEQEVLKDIAPELGRHVHAFLHGGQVGALPVEASWSNASAKLKVLHDAMIQAAFLRQAKHKVMTLSVAVRLQSVILMETLKREYQHVH